MTSTVSIPRSFNGPRASGHGGYSAGVVAGFIDGPAEVTLRRPVPLDRELDVTPLDDRGAIGLLDGETLIAEGRPAPGFALELPAPVSLAEAEEARTRHRGLPDWEFSECFVCGLARADAFRVFAGEVDGRDLVASPWTPAPPTADEATTVRSEIVWAVLDCPTYFAVHLGRELTMSVLARLTATVDAAVVAGQPHVVASWPIASEGRKHTAGIAIFTADGQACARAEALLIELRPA